MVNATCMNTFSGNKLRFDGQAGPLYKIGALHVRSSKVVSETLLHRRLGHCGINKLRAAMHKCKGLPKADPKNPHVPSSSDACLRGELLRSHLTSSPRDLDLNTRSNCLKLNVTSIRYLVKRSALIFAGLSANL